jgi:hypothetical protein
LVNNSLDPTISVTTALAIIASIVSIAGFFVAYLSPKKASDTHITSLIIFFPIYFFVVTSIPIIGYINIRRHRRIENLRAEVGVSVENVISDVLSHPDAPADSEDLEDEVMSQLTPLTDRFKQRRYWRDAEPLVSPEEVRRQLQLHAAADEKTRSSAEKAILALLPPVPRTAKRLLNRLYFLLVVAYNRNLLSLGRVSPEQLGKWAVLLDRWPEAGRVIIKNPQLVQSLEDAAEDQDVFASLCSAPTPPLASHPGPLRDFFQTDPQLGAVAYNLVYLDADVAPPAPSGTPATAPTDARPTAVSQADEASGPAIATPNGRPSANSLTP